MFLYIKEKKSLINLEQYQRVEIKGSGPQKYLVAYTPYKNLAEGETTILLRGLTEETAEQAILSIARAIKNNLSIITL